MMTRLSLILVIGLVIGGGCADCKRDPMPAAPYGPADDTSTYIEGSYISVTYTYYCHLGAHRDVTYTSYDACSYWETAEYTSGCLSFSKQDNWSDCPEESDNE